MSQEICNNGLDDDGDGLIDIQDLQDCLCGVVNTGVIGNFEEMSCCPQMPTSNLNNVGIECLADGWILATAFEGGANYIHLCGYTSNVPLPIPSGNGAIGLNQTSGTNDIIGYCMDNALVVGQNYDLSFYVGFNDTLYPPPSNSYTASPLDFEFVLWGNNSCENLPSSGFGCLEESGNGWVVLTTVPFTGVADNTWLYVSTSFVATDPSTAIAIGGSCDIFQANGYDVTNHFLDDFQLTGQFQVPPTQEITISGDCLNGVFLEVPNVGIGYQWYLDGIAVSGATNYIYQVPSDQQGSYTVRIDFGSSCETLLPVDVFFDINVLDVSGTAADITCFGQDNGYIISTVDPDSNTPLEYNWSNDENSSSIFDLGAGEYDLVVMDSNGCFGSNTFTISEPPEMFVDLIITQSNGINPAQGEVFINGGTPDYDILWCNNNTNNQTTLESGPCWVTVFDANGCEQTLNFEIFDPLQVDVSKDFGSCTDTCDNEIILYIMGGDATYNVMWNISGSDTIQSGLCDGQYAFTVTDGLGTEVIDTIILLSDESSLSITAVYDSLVCMGSNLNTISLSTSGGEPPYSYIWNTQDTTAMIDSLSAGIYTVLVTDSLGCTALDTFELFHYESLTVTSSITPASCSAANGSIDISIPDTIDIQSFIWSTSDTTEDISGLFADNYSVTIIDAFGCMHDYNFIVNSDSDLMVTTAVNHETCEDSNDGDITLTIAGGTAPYSILWEDNTDDNPKENLSAGTYGVTVTDENDCIWTDSISIQTLPQLEISNSIQANSCSDVNDGAIDITIDQGIVSSYAWSNNESTQDINDLSEGFYDLTITDQYGCEYTYIFEVDLKIPFEVTASIGNNLCAGDSTGSLTLNIMPVGSYNYLWSTGASTKNISDLPNGNYAVTITDINECEQVHNYNVNSPPELSLTAELFHIGCDGASVGSITVEQEGGTGSYQYLWTTGDTVPSIQNLDQGNYGLTIQDENNCVLDSSFSILAVNPLLVTDSIQHVSCYGMPDGQITLNFESGNAPYTVLWSTGDAIPEIEDLAAGNYSVTVTDAEGCEYIQNYIIDSPQQLIIQVENLTSPSLLGNDGSIDITINGGSPEYAYLWNQGDTTQDLTGLTWGEYSVLVTDSNGCTATQNWTFDPTELIATNTVQHNKCFGDCEGEITLLISGGTLPYQIVWDDGSTSDQRTLLCDGFYHVTINDATGQTVEVSNVEISSPDQILLSGNVYPVSCLNANDGSISVSTTGGTEPYIYQWEQLETNNDSLSSLSPGEYTIQVIDENLCTESAIFNIEDIDLINLQITQLPFDCEQNIQEFAITGENEYNYDTYINGEISSLSNQVLKSLDPGTYEISYAINPDCILPITTLEIEESQNYDFVIQPLTIEAQKNEVVTVTISEVLGLELSNFEMIWESQNAFTCIDQSCQSIKVTCETEENLKLTVVDPLGCEQYFTIPITLVTDIDDFTISNIFSPNGNNVNDQLPLLPDIEGLTLSTFNIYDRWGNEIYRYLPGSDPYWNGTQGNQLIATGVYVYRASYEYNGEVITKIGDITLVR